MEEYNKIIEQAEIVSANYVQAIRKRDEALFADAVKQLDLITKYVLITFEIERRKHAKRG